ncbi:MAG TPA: hypothetical protein VF054_01930 [Micromonosporaceae bacterium]
MRGDQPAPQCRTPRAPEPHAAVAQLCAQLKELRAQRLVDEAESAQLSTLLRGIVLTRRDRDAGSSPTLSEQRAALERIWVDVEDLVVTTARVAVRLHLYGADQHDPLARRGWRAIERSQAALREFAEAVNAA